MTKSSEQQLNALGAKHNLDSNDVLAACEALKVGVMMCPHNKAPEMAAAIAMMLGTFIGTLGHSDIADEFLEMTRSVDHSHEGN